LNHHEITTITAPSPSKNSRGAPHPPGSPGREARFQAPSPTCPGDDTDGTKGLELAEMLVEWDLFINLKTALFQWDLSNKNVVLFHGRMYHPARVLYPLVII
jgi:hypothetical protein